MVTLDKRDFCSQISKNINRKININHINSVVNLLCEYMVNELKQNKKIEITNFGTFALSPRHPRKYFNVVKQKISFSEGNVLLKFKLGRLLKKFLVSKLDLEKSISEK